MLFGLFRQEGREQQPMAAQYSSVQHNVVEQRSHSLEENLVNEKTTQKPAPRSFASLSWLILTQILGLLWLAPIIILLTLNFSSHIIGPSAWCFHGQCSVDLLDDNAIAQAKRLDKADHNMLGGLQFVAKALELWFGCVAVNLIYNVTMWLASRDEGLPIGLLSASVEFTDPRSLLDTFRSARRSSLQRERPSRPTSRLPLGLFIALIVLMCLLINMMGPATAVLVLPTLQWKDTNLHVEHAFRSLNLSSGPAGDNIFPDCTDGNLNRGQYSCNTDSYAASLDSLVDFTIAGMSQSRPPVNTSLPYGLSQEGDVTLTFNETHDDTLFAGWAPNRQVLREISQDSNDFYEAYIANMDNAQNLTDPKYLQYTRSLQTILKRQGPVLGAYGREYLSDNAFNVELGANRNLRCYNNYSSTANYDTTAQYTKCIQFGTGWTPSTMQASFKIVGSDDTEMTHVDVFVSDKAAYYNSSYNSQLASSACLAGRSAANSSDCPWESIFDAHVPNDVARFSSSILTVELTVPELNRTTSFVAEFLTLAYYNSTYTLDTSPSSNPLYLVQVDDIPNPQDLGVQKVIINPNWFLAAWSVDQNGSLAQNRSAAIGTVRGLKAVLSNTTYNDTSLEEDSTVSVTTSTLLTSQTAASVQQQSAPVGATATGDVAEIRRRVESASLTTVTSAVPVATIASTMGAAKRAAATAIPTSASLTANLTPDSDEQSEIAVDSFDPLAYQPSEKSTEALMGFLLFSYLQALSMVDYSKDNITSSNLSLEDPGHPGLHYYATVHVWMYGLNSRTSYVGVVVACLGIFCVVCSTMLGLVLRRRQRSLTDFIIAAIQHQYKGELANVTGDQEQAARLRFKVEDDERDGKLHFKYVE